MSAIQVIDRSAALLEVIGRSSEPVILKVLAAETGLHPSTAFRILSALIEAGWVEKIGSGYQLGHQLIRLASRVRRSTDLRQEALTVMQQLRDQLGETVNLTVREGDEVIYIERVTSPRMMRVEQVIGSRAPLHVTAVGKLMLAQLGEPFLHAYAQRTGLKRYTRHTLTDKAALLTAVQQAQQAGFAYDNEEAEEGVGCIGVLITNAAGEGIAGLSISAPIERRQAAWVAEVQAAGAAISARLG